MKFAALLKSYMDGTLVPSDLEGVTSEDFLSMRQEAGDGKLCYSLNDEALTELFAPKADEDGAVDYVMVSDGLIPPYSDRILAKAWDLKQFKARGSMVLYDHNWAESRPPIGAMKDVKKGVEMKRKGNTFKALTGKAKFVEKDVYEFAGMIGELVRGGHLTNGSIGFDVLKARPPSEEEQEELGMRPYSTVIEKASPFEFSVTPLGRDINAQTFSDRQLADIEDALGAFVLDGTYSEDTVGLFRADLAEKSGERQRFGILVPKMPELILPESATETLHVEEVEGIEGIDEVVAQFGHLFGIDAPEAEDADEGETVADEPETEGDAPEAESDEPEGTPIEGMSDEAAVSGAEVLASFDRLRGHGPDGFMALARGSNVEEVEGSIGGCLALIAAMRDEQVKLSAAHASEIEDLRERLSELQAARSESLYEACFALVDDEEPATNAEVDDASDDPLFAAAVAAGFTLS